MTRAAIYARFSSSRQREESIEDQVRVCRSYAAAHGMEVAHVYSDEARSGTDASRRPGFQRCIADAQRGLFDALIVYKVDRFARNRFDSATYKARLRKAGVELVSATEAVPDGPEGIILDSVLEGMAEYYSANLSQNIRRGIEGNALKCRHNGQPVFGYARAEDGMYRVDAETAPAVESAYRMAAAGETMSSIARSLNARGYRTIRGGKWACKSVGNMIRSQRYRGVYSYAGHKVEGGMPRVVSDELWTAANARVGSARGGRRGGDEHGYLLSGIFFTDRGERLTPDCGRSHTGAVYRYYRSRSGRSIRADEADSRVRRALSDFLADDSMDESIVDAVMAEQERALGEEIAATRSVDARIAELERSYSNAIDLAAAMGPTPKIVERIRAYETELESLKTEREELEASIPRIEPDFVRFFLHKMRTCGAPDAVARGFVTRAVMGPDGSIDVQFVVMPALEASPGAGSGNFPVVPPHGEPNPNDSKEPAGCPAGSGDLLVVETKGIEPSASAMRRQRSPS